MYGHHNLIHIQWCTMKFGKSLTRLWHILYYLPKSNPFCCDQDIEIMFFESNLFTSLISFKLLLFLQGYHVLCSTIFWQNTCTFLGNPMFLWLCLGCLPIWTMTCIYVYRSLSIKFVCIILVEREGFIQREFIVCLWNRSGRFLGILSVESEKGTITVQSLWQ